MKTQQYSKIFFIIFIYLVCLFQSLNGYLINKFIQDNLVTIKDDDNIVCRNELDGEPLDWFTLYKLPKQSNVEVDRVNNPFIYKGTAYLYMSNKQTSWALSGLSINDTSSMPAQTLNKLYETDFSNPNTDIGYVLYNDQADKITISQGHTKGVILFNKKSAIWIVHSIPHYPPKSNLKNYYINSSQCVYGQSMLCMSFGFEQLGLIGQQLMYNYPQVYDSFIPDNLNDDPILSNLINVIRGGHVNQAPWFSLNTIETIGGQNFLSLSKYTLFEDDLYAALVAPKLGSDLLTETWNNGAGTLPSNCSSTLKYQVHNIEEVYFYSIGTKFSVHHDHSKWAVTTLNNGNDYNDDNNDQQVKVACIGDINRQEEQYRRAGGTVCFLNNEKIWEQYRNLVGEIQPCPRKRAIRKFKVKDSNETIILLK